MASKHIWRAADAGVMLWQSATDTTLDSTHIQASLVSSYDDDEGQTILPSIEEVFETHIKDEPAQNLHKSPSSHSSNSPTTSSHQKDHTLTRARSSSSTSSDLLCGTNWYGQLKASLQPFNEQDIVEPPDGHPSSTGTRLERKNSEFTASSPCPIREFAAQPLETPIASHCCNNVNLANNSKPLQRKLDFHMVMLRDKINVEPQSVHSCGIPSLVALRKLERDPPHQWHEDERELLTILYRWYMDPTAISKVFNAVTGLQLRHHVVRYQFESHVLLYGGRAFPEYQRVMTIPFHDPEERYKEIRNIIEKTAIEFGINLPRRLIDTCFNSGQARYAKSPKTRKLYKALVRRAAEKERERVRELGEPQLRELEAEPEPEPLLQACMLGQTTLAMSSEREDEEAWSDLEESLSSISISPGTPSRLPPGTHHIGFRVWDEDSRTFFSEESGFVSEAFARFWNGEYPPPFSPEGQGLQALKILTNLHLSLSGGASTFVSVSTSLLQALVKASKMKDPRIAIVALDHPLLTAPNKTIHAAEIMQMLKGEGLAWWAKYKGIAEQMVWSDLPASTILSYFPLADLQSLSDHDHSCSEILSLECIQPGRRTHFVSSQMRERNKILNTNTARAIGSVSRTFGMHRKDVSLTHIRDLIASLVDSFKIQENSATDIHTASSIASTFALALRSREHLHQHVMQAFQDGVKQGIDTINYYSGRGRGRGRRHAATTT